MVKGEVHKKVDGRCYVYTQKVVQVYVRPCEAHNVAKKKPGRKPKA